MALLRRELHVITALFVLLAWLALGLLVSLAIGPVLARRSAELGVEFEEMTR
jgi:hypothetical protein